jgi:hypothetical protein
MLVRLTALQQFQQTSHLAVPDELLNFFLSDSSTVGSGGDSELRRRVRREARMRVGFDPYDESPIKRRGEDYLENEFHDGTDGYDIRMAKHPLAPGLRRQCHRRCRVSLPSEEVAQSRLQTFHYRRVRFAPRYPPLPAHSCDEPRIDRISSGP